ncbi:MAG: A/G-specific adenine glycosylase [Pseudomonadota bacterium]|nr:A/G-specific adenine glycosylase [Pseudomonadota bacterium]
MDWEGGADPSVFADRLLRWFDHAGRHDLPWQGTGDAYRVWVSEIMLQQTQVNTVIPYYQRFMARFPDVTALAAASEDVVLGAWSGLGYYARARNLHRAARQVVALYDGRFPVEFDQLINLPGVGRSTAGAIAALAAGRRHPILDGNVKRVLSRLFAIGGDPSSARVQRALWDMADTLTPRVRVADYTQAVMDLGATVCTRARPDCAQCPVSDLCSAYRQGEQHAFPAPRRRVRIKTRQLCFVIVGRARDEVLLERRAADGIWGGLWCFPEVADSRGVDEWCRVHLGVPVQAREVWDPIEHVLTHLRLKITPVRVLMPPGSVDAPQAAYRRGVWYTIGQPAPGGLAAPVRALINQLSL